MSKPLDDARMLLEECAEGTDENACGYCGDWGYAEDDEDGLHPRHDDECQVPMLTQIVAALEAAEELYDHCAALHWGESPDYGVIQALGTALQPAAAVRRAAPVRRPGR